MSSIPICKYQITWNLKKLRLFFSYDRREIHENLEKFHAMAYTKLDLKMVRFVSILITVLSLKPFDYSAESN